MLLLCFFGALTILYAELELLKIKSVWADYVATLVSTIEKKNQSSSKWLFLLHLSYPSKSFRGKRLTGGSGILEKQSTAFHFSNVFSSHSGDLLDGISFGPCRIFNSEFD